MPMRVRGEVLGHLSSSSSQSLSTLSSMHNLVRRCGMTLEIVVVVIQDRFFYDFSHIHFVALQDGI